MLDDIWSEDLQIYYCKDFYYFIYSLRIYQLILSFC